MTGDEFVARERPEPEYHGRWGLISLKDGTWVPIIYRNERDALRAAAIMNGRAAPDFPS
ncbi:hypothetical protein FHS96_003087 [Sphingomonas zeicaulis]